ncbi:hypothetical protein ZX71_003205 [Salmonella enterica subsp. enterica]|nr:hypothetical protein [Salmonella enterica subsp. enterica serovar Javiana]EDW0161292.1 hypothetical protein [Salmonella enterica subsp. enterica serovar Javiana]
MITPETASQALSSWLAYPQITQETATQLITRAFLEQPARPEIAVHRIERDDGTVDYDAWRRNRINIFQRWRKRETAEHCEKFSALIPAILEAIRESAPELHKRITAGQSIEYLLSQLLKKPQWQARYFLARRWRILSGSVTRPYMRYRRYVAVNCATAAICQECHHEIDNGSHLSREERRCLMNRAIVLTVIEVARRGLVVPA